MFVSESERIYQHEGMQAFMDNGRAKADIPLQKGPFAIFLLTIAHIQESFKDISRLRLSEAKWRRMK